MEDNVLEVFTITMWLIVFLFLVPKEPDTGPAACPLMVVGLIILFGFLGLIISFMLPALRYNLGVWTATLDKRDSNL